MVFALISAATERDADDAEEREEEEENAGADCLDGIRLKSVNDWQITD